MKGNFLLKLIFCFALGPRLRVPVDLHKEGSLLFYEMGLTKPTILRIEKACQVDTVCSIETLCPLTKVAFEVVNARESLT